MLQCWHQPRATNAPLLSKKQHYCLATTVTDAFVNMHYADKNSSAQPFFHEMCKRYWVTAESPMGADQWFPSGTLQFAKAVQKDRLNRSGKRAGASTLYAQKHHPIGTSAVDSINKTAAASTFLSPQPPTTSQTPLLSTANQNKNAETLRTRTPFLLHQLPFDSIGQCDLLTTTLQTVTGSQPRSHHQTMGVPMGTRTIKLDRSIDQNEMEKHAGICRKEGLL
jgi:hypothetical protein